MPELIRDRFSKNNSSATITTERSPIGDTAPTQLSNPVRLLFLWLILLAVVSSQACASKKLTPSGPGTVTATLSPDSFPFIRKAGKDRLIVFVHGVLGDYRGTWTADNGAYWPDLLKGDPKFNDYDIYTYGYSSPVLGASLTINELAEQMRLRFDDDRILASYKSIVFLCHSMGGLVVRNYLLKYRDAVSHVPMIYFFATPTVGSDVANIVQLFWQTPLGKLVGRFKSPNHQFDDLIPWKDGNYVANLALGFHAAHFKINKFCAYETRPTKGIKIVSQISATYDCDERLDPMEADHPGIVKPADRNSPPYIAFRSAVDVTFNPPPPPPLPPGNIPAPPPPEVTRTAVWERYFDVGCGETKASTVDASVPLETARESIAQVVDRRVVEGIGQLVQTAGRTATVNLTAEMVEFSN